MRKISFVATLILLGVISTSTLAQNYYDPGFYQNNNQQYSNSYNAQSYGHQNYGYYTQTPQYYNYQQQAPQYPYYQRQAQNSNNGNVVQPKKTETQRGVGTVSVGADYVMGYFRYESKKDKFEELISGVGDYTYSTSEFERRNDAVSFNIGWRPLKFLGIEAFYTSSLGFNNKENVFSHTYIDEFEIVERETSYQGYGIDIIGYHKINDFIEFLASIGVGKYDVEADITVSLKDANNPARTLDSKSKTFEDSVTAYRIGGGFQLWISRYIAFRLTGRWTNLGGEFSKYITEVNAGIRYHF